MNRKMAADAIEMERDKPEAWSEEEARLTQGVEQEHAHEHGNRTGEGDGVVRTQTD